MILDLKQTKWKSKTPY